MSGLLVDLNSRETVLSIEPIDIIAARSIAAAVYPIARAALNIKGTEGRYGIRDYFKFKIVMALKERFLGLTVNEDKQRRFYDHFNAVKNALQAKTDRPNKIKQSYDQLVRVARSWTSGELREQKPFDEAVLSILKDELSEQTTQDLLHDILMLEGTKIMRDATGKISLETFISMLNRTVEKEVESNYGTKDVIENTMISAAAEAVSTEDSENFLKKVEDFVTKDFDFTAELESYLKDFAEQINKLLQGKTNITKEMLDRVEHRGVFLMKNVSNSQEFIEKLEMVRQKLDQANKRVQALDSQSMQASKKLNRLQNELEEPRNDYLYAHVVGYKSDKKITQSSDARKKELEEKEKQYQAKKAEILKMEVNPNLKTVYGLQLAQLELLLIESDIIKLRDETVLVSLIDRLNPETLPVDLDTPITLSYRELLVLPSAFPGMQAEIGEGLERAKKVVVAITRSKKELDQVNQDREAALREYAAAKLTKDNLPQAIVESVSSQVREKFKAQAKEKFMEALSVVYRTSEIRAVAGLREWENTFNGLNPSLQKAYLASGRVIVRFSSDQLNMVRCEELEARLSSRK